MCYLIPAGLDRRSLIDIFCSRGLLVIIQKAQQDRKDCVKAKPYKFEMTPLSVHSPCEKGLEFLQLVNGKKIAGSVHARQFLMS
jgi:hypothetical protein